MSLNDWETLEFDFNVTSYDAVVDENNTANVYFSSADDKTSLETAKVQEVVGSIWSQFLAGNWANNLTFVGDRAAYRTWNFEEESNMDTSWWS